MTALTAVTIQNTQGVKSVVSIPANEIYNQIIHTTKDIKPDAIKIAHNLALLILQQLLLHRDLALFEQQEKAHTSSPHPHAYLNA